MRRATARWLRAHIRSRLADRSRMGMRRAEFAQWTSALLDRSRFHVRTSRPGNGFAWPFENVLCAERYPWNICEKRHACFERLRRIAAFTFSQSHSLTAQNEGGRGGVGDFPVSTESSGRAYAG